MARRESFLPRLSVDRPVTVIMMLVALLMVGAIAYHQIPVSLAPEGLENQRLNIWVSYPNASPFEVEKKIARHLEEAMATVSRVKKVTSNSHRGGCWASIEFRQGTDMKVAYAELRDRMDRVMPDLPDEVERIAVRHWDSEDWPIIWMGVSLDQEVTDPFFLVDTHLRPALQRIEGVGNVEIHGSEGKQVRIEVDQERTRSHGISPLEMTTRLRRENFTLSGGHVREGGKKIYVRSLGKFHSLDEIRNLIVEPVHGIRLGDLADIDLKPPEQEWISRIGGKEMMGVEIKKASNGNIVDISRQVHLVLEEMQSHPQLAGLQFEIFFNQGEHVLESIDNLKSTALWGGLFAALVLFFFLRAVRMTLIITLAIPLSLLATVVVLYFVGWSLNIGTMMGLMLSLGLVVDNAIVIVENIYRKRQGGDDPRTASVQGASEVGLAVTMATLTTAVVFLPLMLMSDEQEFSFWMLRIGIPVIVGLVSSLFIALVFIPLAAQRLTPQLRDSGEGGLVARLREQYTRFLDMLLRRRLDALIVSLVLLASMQYPMNQMQRTDQQQENRTDLWLVFDMPSGQSLEAAGRFMGSVEDTLMAYQQEYNIRTLETGFNRGFGRVHVLFKEDPRTQWYQVAYDKLLTQLGLRQATYMNYQEVLKDVEERIIPPPGTSMRVNWQGGGEDATLSINLYGEDTRVLVGLAREVERRLRGIPGLLSVYTDMERGVTELQVRLDRDQAERFGVNSWEVSSAIGAALRGEQVGRFLTDKGREVDIHIQLKEGDRRNIQQLQSITFETDDGREVPLESMSTLFVSRSLGQIRREDRQTMLTVTATATQGDAQGLFAEVDQAMQGFEMPRGYRWDKGARYVRLEESDQSQRFALILSVTFVFLLMGVLFESFVLPLSVIISIPFSFLGVYWFLYLTGTPFDIMSGIGTVILIGVVVNNAIVLIDLANRLRADGMERHRALIEAGKHRFRPILMTTFTTICGLIPMAVGNSKMIGMPYAPLGRTMMGGLLASTFLTLVIVPLFYTFFDDLRLLVRGIMASVVESRSRSKEGPAV
ncbi:MAG: MMPL family transporter [Candidatus Latescibacteria bacterium]|nr:MMPL family transporter [Candidatus Latescibacterota bacterium]